MWKIIFNKINFCFINKHFVDNFLWKKRNITAYKAVLQ